MPATATVAHTRADDDAAPREAGALAAIDLGSNSFRLEIGEVDGDRYRRIDYLKETVRLGAGLDADGVLGEEAVARGLDCLTRFGRRLEGVPASRVRAVATQTLREATNRDAFLARAQKALGKPIEVISGREEARLIFAGVARLQPSSIPRLVVDIGGRSTEMILGQRLRPERAESFQVGSVALSMRYFPEGRFTAAAFRAAQIAAGAELEEGLVPFAPRHWREALGSSGTVGAVSQVLAASGHGDGRITAPHLRWMIERCIAAGSADRLDVRGLKEERRAVLGGGLAILYTLATQFGIDELVPARGALRQGVIFDLDARLGDGHGGGDIRDATVAALQRRFRVDREQAARVAAAADATLDGLSPEAGGEARRELRWAALLHEAGTMVSHHDHHRHSAYLLSHVDAAGFSQSQLRRVAELVLGQRGGLRKLETRLADPVFAMHLLALRLAIVACHARDGKADGTWSVQGDATAPVITLDRAAVDANPRMLHLLREEIESWGRVGALSPTLSVA